ncbi:MAG: mannitol dehydrogenase family protein [Roseobacter sp.]|jgi:mannitol 2-dehydrogenase|nr:mannitol dehydrogenase family protein [Roseobacter sp.]
MDELTKTNAVALRQETLHRLPADVEVPRYDRSQLRPGIVHIGLGNFHRAHQAWYLHRLMQQGLAHDWAIVGAGVRAGDAVMRDKLLAQDCLTTLIELRPDGTSAEVCGSMIDFLPVAEDNAPLIAAMADPQIRIVALTVTEGGYYLQAASGRFDADHPDIRADVASPDSPRTAFGAIVAALARRKTAGHGPFTVQSCDNLRGNGAIVREVVTSLARLVDVDLADWIEAHASFPNSMVDSIVPATGEEEVAKALALGIEDKAPVTHENFRQWVIEDDFCAGRPPWDKAGAVFSTDVHAYESMKIRILNAGHQVLANAGELLSMPTIADCMAHPTIAAFFRKVQSDEIAPYVVPVPGMTASEYAVLIATRFSNPAIRDTTRRVAFDGASRHSGFVLPILRDALAAQGTVQGLSLCEALWARMCQGTREDGSQIAPNDPFWADLTQQAEAARRRPDAWLEQSQYYGDLAQTPEFRDAFSAWLEMLWSAGTEATLAAYVKGTGTAE